MKTTDPSKPTLDEIAEAVCRVTGVDRGDLRGDRQTTELVLARKVFCHISTKCGHIAKHVAAYLNRARSIVPYWNSCVTDLEQPDTADKEREARRMVIVKRFSELDGEALITAEL